MVFWGDRGNPTHSWFDLVTKRGSEKRARGRAGGKVDLEDSHAHGAPQKSNIYAFSRPHLSLPLAIIGDVEW